MNVTIRKIKLHNYKRFIDYEIIPNERINVLIGDNEVGKSTVLEAIDLVISGSVHRVESLGIEKLLNMSAISQFMNGEKTYEKLPTLRVELYLSGDFSFSVKGKNNTDKDNCFGIRLVCEPDDDFRTEITKVLNENDTDYFPYDYYSIRFSTFADEGYSGHNRIIQSLFIDNSAMNSEYATNEFVRRIYNQQTSDDIKERAIHKSLYRQSRNNFSEEGFKSINTRLSDLQIGCSFGLKNLGTADFEKDLMVFEDKIAINCKGMGRQVFIKTDFAIERSQESASIVLIEEPENHLSPTNLRKLINHVLQIKKGQLFISTHSSFISTRLQLRNVLIMHIEEESKPVVLKDLSENTAKYFIKSPPASVVEFALAKRSILVEGPSEYMLMDLFYKTITGKEPEEDDVHIINVRGLSFKRYLEIAHQTKCKVAVITDNDGDSNKNCIQKYSDYNYDSNIDIFFEENNDIYTFEVALYRDNASLINRLFNIKNPEYLLNNKTEVAFSLMEQEETIIVPDYISRAIRWIRE